MAARLIVTGRNSLMPLDAAQASGGSIARRYRICRECEGNGWTNVHDHIDPSAKNSRIVCPECNGEGAFIREEPRDVD